jgi:integrase
MRYVNYKLTPPAIDKAKPAADRYDLTDGGGLVVEVMTSGTKVWRFKYRLNGKREKVTIGPYPAISIKAAHDRHEELRTLVARGESPAQRKQEEIVERKAAEASAVTFRVFAQTWIADTLFHRSAAYRAQIVRWLDSHVYPRIGNSPLGDVLPADVLAIIEPLRKTPTTADRVRVIIQQIYNHAIRKLIVTTNPAAPLRGVIKLPPKVHHPHLRENQIGHFWRVLAVQGAHAVTTFAAQMLMLTMVRKNELLRARWPEFDLDAAVWDIPAERMKMKRPHRVYLARQALEILRVLVPHTRHEPNAYVFPSLHRRTMPLGESTLNHLFDRMDIPAELSPHGLRGTAATLLREHGFSKDVVELLLAHDENDKTAASYHHHEMPDERRRALQFLADQVDHLASSAEVISLRLRAA